MSDSFTERSSQSWFSRIGGAIAGMLIGLILFLVAFPVLFWNEGRAIKREKTLDTGSKEVVTVAAAPIDSANAGKLVHVTGKTVASGPIEDEAFGITASAIKLRRDVEMYQWVEDKKSETQQKLGGGEETVTTYSYNKKWTSELVDSSEFKKPEGHDNPSQMAVESDTFIAADVTVGDFSLPDSLVDMMNDYKDLPITKKMDPKVSSEVPEPVQLSDNGFYIGADPKQPAVGDLKIHFQVIEPGDVSIIARQTQKTFEPYIVKGQGDIELLQAGTVSAENMFAAAQQENVVMTWLLRLGGFVMMFFGLLLIVKPLSVLASVVPFLGSLAEMGLGLLAFVISLPLTLITVALAWLAYRPLIGLPLLVVAAAVVFFGFKALGKRRAAAAPKAAAA